MKWEYMTLHIEAEGQETEEMLDKHGLKEWELVCSYAWHGHWLIMKRPIKRGRK